MNRRLRHAILLAAVLCSSTVCADAGVVSVQPILLELTAPASSSLLQLRSTESSAVVVQTRVERWTQVDGVEKLERTTDVVSSPPAVRMMPNTDYVVRIVRVSRAPVQGEESYRVIVDQLPIGPKRSGAGINLLIRQSIPVFSVGMDNGANASGSQRRMRLGTTSSYITYNLYTDSARSNAWTTTTAAGSCSGGSNSCSLATGIGSTQTVNIYGRVPPQNAPAVGTFTDTVVITLTY